ncbi:DNA translocase FtsK [Mesoplasma lactucae]|uniref:DNA translocase FtsK n=1 Tax=Mesoplasma lactucae ATCC 49193 TaxID=81460 RepID=A0A291IRD1_9MOLU|nr:DNA translocase FtsK [Mesoplasma lactucae]ATG97251.1 DNA translocase FtsK [Mesoplasma lactucae ATCC 49193]ATZ20302.1 DNA translocase [Mesoplasma lactucae ATCC 49193]MCL8216473.1 DNA translocase FtsK [Mesoplasma lactucae ATCC 49193]
MRKKKIKEISGSNTDGSILTSKNYNDDRTIIFQTEKKPHKKDSIAWLVGSITFFLLLVLSVGRFLTIGAFLDDIFFNFLFGWLKYPVYLLLFAFDISILVGIKFRMKKSFVFMILAITFSIAWIISTSLLLNLDVHKEDGIKLWNKDIFPKSVSVYSQNWYDNSILGTTFRDEPGHKKYLIYPSYGYVNLYQGGGFIGTFLSGIFGYLSLPGSLVLAFFCLFLSLVWFLTGTPFFLFYSKEKRKGKRVRVLPLAYKNNPHVNGQEADKTPKPFIEDDVERTDRPRQIGPKKSLADSIAWNEPDDDDLETFSVLRDSDETDYENVGKKMLEEHVPEKPAQPTVSLDTKTDEPIIDDTLETFDSYTQDSIHVDNLDDSIFYDEIMKDEEPEQNDKTEYDSFTFDDLDSETLATIQQLEEDETISKTVGNDAYQLPSLDLLNDVRTDPRVIKLNEDNARQKAEAINQTFAEFKVNAKVVNTIIGPAVTKFEIKPDKGTKANSIANLEADLKLALATQNIRIESPIPGKSLVGIEIPNVKPTMVGLKEILRDLPSSDADDKLIFGLGKDVVNKSIFGDIQKMPHLLVAGSTGSGKSVMTNTLITSILLRAKPSEVKLLLIDPKQVELAIYSDVPHMLAPVISDMSKATRALNVVVAEMDRRYKLFAEGRARNLEGYNAKQKDPKDKVPYYVVVIDELADLMITGDRKEVEDAIQRITQMGRAAGIHLIVATQRPSVDVITGVIKANIPTRIAFRVSSGIDSRTILDASGAENLTGKGDMLYRAPNTTDLLRAQGAYLSDEEIDRVVDWVCQQQDKNYNKAFTELNSKVANNNANNGKEHDELFEEVKQFAINEGAISTSLIQRKFNIGYNRAANIVDDLEANQIIGPQNGSKPREVYLKPDQERSL